MCGNERVDSVVELLLDTEIFFVDLKYEVWLIVGSPEVSVVIVASNFSIIFWAVTSLAKFHLLLANFIDIIKWKSNDKAGTIEFMGNWKYNNFRVSSDDVIKLKWSCTDALFLKKTCVPKEIAQPCTITRLLS